MLEISAWLPNQWAINEAHSRQSDYEDAAEGFISNHCLGCKYNTEDIYLCGSDVDDMEWEDGDGVNWPIINATAESPCAFGRGFDLGEVRFPCCAGHDSPCDDDDNGIDELVLGPTRFTARRLLTQRDYMSLVSANEFTAVLQNFNITPTGILAVSNTRRLSNTYDPSNVVCWGNYNTKPRFLSEAAEAYAESEANDDLLPVRSCARNCSLSQSDPAQQPLNQLAIPIPAETKGDLALLVADAATMPDAFLLLAASGAAVKNGIAIAAAEWAAEIVLPDGTLFTGWMSAPLAGGMSWLIGHAINNHAGNPDLFMLLGQHNPNPTTPATCSPCNSPALSSSAAAEQADTSSRLLPAC